MKSIARLLLTFSAAVASWAACPVGVTPAQIINSSTWAFQLKAGDYSPTGSALVGTFAPLTPGLLKVSVTYTNAGVAVRKQDGTARYILYPDCTGGELLFYLNGLSFQLEFVFVENFTQLYLVTDELVARYGGTTSLTGYARPTTSGCPAGLGDPLNIINGTTWSFRTFAGYFRGPGSASVGMFSPVNLGGSGRLTGTETISYGGQGPIVRGAQLSGRYIIYPDCSGGEIMLMNRGNPVPSLQLEFVFVGPNFSEMYMINDSFTPVANIGIGPSVVVGIAQKF